MKYKALIELFSLRDLRNAVTGLVVVLGGIGLSGLTYYAHLTGQPRLAGIAAGVSLVFVLLILIFVVPPLARNASKEASQLNLPFDVTAGGAIMLGLIAIVGFSAWNTGNNLLFLVLSFLAGSMVVGFFAGSICLKKLDVKMRFPETIFAGQDTPILVSIHNRKRLFPSFSVVAEVRGKERDTSIVFEDLKKILPERLAARLTHPPIVRRLLSYFVYLARGQVTENRNVHVFQNRGRFVIKDFELSTRFPFGFFRHRRRLPARETELIVFPALEPLDRELDDLPLGAGKIVTNKRGSGQDLLALRDYQPNDDLRRVDWKATARARHLIVREFAAEDDKKVTIYFDTRVLTENAMVLTLREKIDAEQQGKSLVESTRFERGVSVTASLLTHFCDQQAEIRLSAPDEQGEFGIGSRHLYSCLRRLAVFEPEFVAAGETVFTSERSADVFEDSENSHNFLVSSIEENTPKSDYLNDAVVIRF